MYWHAKGECTRILHCYAFQKAKTSAGLTKVKEWHLERGSFEKYTLVFIGYIGDCEALWKGFGVQCKTCDRTRKDIDCQGNSSDSCLFWLLCRS